MELYTSGVKWAKGVVIPSQICFALRVTQASQVGDLCTVVWGWQLLVGVSGSAADQAPGTCSSGHSATQNAPQMP
jgi:hypothetical protein